MSKLDVRVISGASADMFACESERLEPEDGDAQLLIGSPVDEATVAGAFERRQRGILRRGSGGASVNVGPGTIWMILRLSRASALVPCEPSRLMNRYVRPLLKGLGRSGAPAAYFDRDWFAVAHRPAGMVAFAHDATTGACTFEAFVAVTTPFAPDAAAARASYRGKTPGTLESLASKTDVVAIAEAIRAAYAEGHDATSTALLVEAPDPPRERASDDPPWLACRDEAIGRVAASRTRVGGEFMASRDAVARLDAGLPALPEDATPDAIGALVDETLGAPGVVLFGVRSLTSIRDAIVASRSSPAATT